MSKTGPVEYDLDRLFFRLAYWPVWNGQNS